MKTKNLLQSSGKISDTHYASYYPELGLTIIKQYPRKRKKDEWTEGQKEQRNRFAIINAFAKKNLFSLIRPIWNMQKGDGLNGYNRFIKKNSQAFDREGVIKQINRLVLSSGVLPAISCLESCVDVSKKELCIKWDTYRGRKLERDYDDLAYIIYRENTSLKPIKTPSKRKDGLCLIKLESEDLKMGDVIFLFFSDYKMNNFSDSLPLEIISDNLQI